MGSGGGQTSQAWWRAREAGRRGLSPSERTPRAHEPWSGKAHPHPTVFMRGSQAPPSCPQGLDSETPCISPQAAFSTFRPQGSTRDVWTQDDFFPHLLLSCCSLQSLGVAPRLGARGAHAMPVCTHLPAGRSPLLPVNSMLKFLPFVFFLVC